MATLLFQYLAICSNKFTKAGSKFSQIQNRPYNELPKSFKISPKSQNFVKFGHTGAFIEEIFWYHQDTTQRVRVETSMYIDQQTATSVTRWLDYFLA